jgi:hypothetical protein
MVCSQGCRCAPNLGLKLANAFGVIHGQNFKLRHYPANTFDGFTSSGELVVAVAWWLEDEIVDLITVLDI